jgi:prepilin-type processing-associated H-X9-DG protein
MFAKGGLPATYWFKTGEGNMGVLQIVGFTQRTPGPRGVKIRYKMVQKEAGPLVQAAARRVFLPECDTTTYDLLDLASGKIINSEPGGKMLDIGDPHGKGNLYFDRMQDSDWLASVRGTSMRLRTDGGLSSPQPDVMSRGIAAYYALREIPCQYLVTTAQGDKYELKVLSIETGDKPGVHIEYWKSAGAPLGLTGAVAVLHADPAVKLSRLGQAVAVYAADNNGKMPATLKELKPYLCGDDFKWLIENVKYFGKGQESQEPDTPIAYDKTLLEKGNGTNILFLDGHVEFRQAEELTSVKHTIEHR